MNINIQKLQEIVTGIIAVGVCCVFGYFTYVVFFTGPVEEAGPSLATVNVSAFSSSPKILKIASAVSGSAPKIAIKKKDYLFIETSLYKSFIDDPVDVPLSEKRGRPDPFVPYATP